jgi:ERCC4-type nuclease
MKIIVDTREKYPLTFSWFSVETISKKLDTGDYTLDGHENELCIDRKASISELYTNMFKDYIRFKKELERMGPFKEKYIVCEFPYYHVSDFPLYGIPNSKISALKFNAGHLIDKIEHIKEKYGVEFIFCDDRHEAERQIYELLKEFYNNEKK